MGNIVASKPHAQYSGPKVRSNWNESHITMASSFQKSQMPKISSVFFVFLEVHLVGAVIQHGIWQNQYHAHCSATGLEPIGVSKFECMSSHENSSKYIVWLEDPIHRCCWGEQRGVLREHGWYWYWGKCWFQKSLPVLGSAGRVWSWCTKSELFLMKHGSCWQSGFKIQVNPTSKAFEEATAGWDNWSGTPWFFCGLWW